ncbi:MAG: GNAT family N-acetyltransferase [Acholeplasmataceae bacterium]|nr:GNAT family N-acetyltransferase [Acholeplasmataceae bacterium]
MNYRKMLYKDLLALNRFWNQHKDSLFKEMEEKEIESKFFTCTNDYDIISFIAYDKNDIIGFASGTYVKNTNVAYLTCILVNILSRRQHIGTKLLELMENEFIKNEQIKRIDISFFNPVHLEWFIPGTLSSDHPNVPGVEINSSYYKLLQKNSYFDFAIQNAYYMKLKDYQFSPDIEEKRNKLKALSVEIRLYQSNIHSGFEALFDDLKNDHWRKEITQNNQDEKLKHDVLIVEKNGLIYGFAGPLTVQKSGRGNFAGIGVHSSLRGLGAGSVLFASLCMAFKKIGAQYMSIFTGENNKARHIYETEGFRCVKTWANMRKELKKGD